MFNHVLDQIMSPNIELKTEVNICRSSHSSTFVKSSTDLSKVVSRLYPSSNPSSGRFRKHSIYATVRGEHDGGRGGRFNVIYHGRVHKGRGGRVRGGHGQVGRGGGSRAY